MFDLSRFDFQFATEKAIDTALNLIDFYDLHQNPYEPVDVTELLDKFDIRFLDLPETTCGFTLDIEHKIIIALNNEMSTELTRYVAMHEVGHVACWHPNQLNNCLEGQWLYDHLESEATTVAALVLIPQAAVVDPVLYTVDEIAEQYVVPPELIIIRRLLYKSKGI